MGLQTGLLSLALVALIEQGAPLRFLLGQRFAQSCQTGLNLLDGFLSLGPRLLGRLVLFVGIFGGLFGGCNGDIGLLQLLALRINPVLKFIQARAELGAARVELVQFLAGSLDFLLGLGAFQLARHQGGFGFGFLVFGLGSLRLDTFQFGLGFGQAFAGNPFLVGQALLLADGILAALGQRTAAFFKHGQAAADRLALVVQSRRFTVPFVQLGAQFEQPLAGGVESVSQGGVVAAGLIQAAFLLVGNFADFRKFLLGAVPVIAIPLTQDQLQVSLNLHVFLSAFGLALEQT